jgi:hypothetical protein
MIVRPFGGQSESPFPSSSLRDAIVCTFGRVYSLSIFFDGITIFVTLLVRRVECLVNMGWEGFLCIVPESLLCITLSEKLVLPHDLSTFVAKTTDLQDGDPIEGGLDFNGRWIVIAFMHNLFRGLNYHQ